LETLPNHSLITPQRWEEGENQWIRKTT